MNIVSASRVGKERFYAALMIVFGALGWVAIAAALYTAWQSDDEHTRAMLTIYLTYGGLFVLYRLLAPLVYRAYSYGNSIRLAQDQFPALHAMVAEGAGRLGFANAPTAFLYNSNGLFNAFAARVLGGRFVYLTSALVEANDDAQVRFVIGHELGHHAAGHLNPWLNLIKFPAHFVPLLGAAYSRARETTCDAIGFRLAPDLPAAQSALAMLGCGCRRMNAGLNCEAFAAQEAQVPAIFGWLSEIFRSHPRLTRRVRAIAALAAADSRTRQAYAGAVFAAHGLAFGDVPRKTPSE